MTMMREEKGESDSREQRKIGEKKWTKSSTAENEKSGHERKKEQTNRHRKITHTERLL